MYHYEKIEEAKKAKKETIFPQVHSYLEKLDAIVKKNGGFLVDCGQVRICNRRLRSLNLTQFLISDHLA